MNISAYSFTFLSMEYTPLVLPCVSKVSSWRVFTNSKSEFKINGFCWPKIYYKKNKKQYSKKLRFAIFNENKFIKYIDIPVSIIMYN